MKCKWIVIQIKVTEMADIAVETSEAQEAIKNLVLKAEEKEGGGEMKEVDIANNIYWIIYFWEIHIKCVLLLLVNQIYRFSNPKGGGCQDGKPYYSRRGTIQRKGWKWNSGWAQEGRLRE